MYPVSAAFLAQLRSPSMQAMTKIVTNTGLTLSAISGKVDMDGQRSIQRTCDLELIPTATLSLEEIYALVMSPTIELTVYRGLVLNGVPELVPLGVFSTDNAEYGRKGTSTVGWHGSDRGKKIARSHLTDAYQITAGTTLAAAGTTFLQSRWAAMPCDFSNVLEVLQAGITFDAGADSNPWDLARKLFADHGYDLAADGLGTARAATVADPATVPADFDFGTGTTQLVLDGKTRGSLETTYNGVIVTGEGADIEPPVRGEAWDTDPTSPTYYLGGFGKVPYFMSSPVLTTVAACQKAAATRLAKVKGRKEQLSWESIVNPALVPLDIVTASLRSSESRLVLDQLSIPLAAAEAMPATAREISTT